MYIPQKANIQNKEHVNNQFIISSQERDEPQNENGAKHLISCLIDAYKGAEQSIKPMDKQEFKKENISQT